MMGFGPLCRDECVPDAFREGRSAMETESVRSRPCLLANGTRVTSLRTVTLDTRPASNSASITSVPPGTHISNSTSVIVHLA